MRNKKVLTILLLCITIALVLKLNIGSTVLVSGTNKSVNRKEEVVVEHEKISGSIHQSQISNLTHENEQTSNLDHENEQLKRRSNTVVENLTQNVALKTIKQLLDIEQKDLPKGMQMGLSQVKIILKAIVNASISQDVNSYATTNLFIWGLGNDSPFWYSVTAGKKIFVEDNSKWIREITEKYKYLNAVKVKYTTNLQETTFNKYTTSKTFWNELDLRKQLPNWVIDTRWDVFIVDAPAGDTSTRPGRYQSIYTTSLLKKGQCWVIVDDCHRKLEQVFGEKIFGLENKIGEESRKEHIEKRYITKTKAIDVTVFANKQCYYWF